MYTHREIEEALFKGRQRAAEEIAKRISSILEKDRAEAYTAAAIGRSYEYEDHMIANKTGISIFMIIQEVEKVLGKEESRYLQIKQLPAYSRKGRLTKKRTFFSKKVSAVSFRWNRRKR